MARGGENQKPGRSTAEQQNPEAGERKRLRKLAISKNLLSETPSKASSIALNPSKTVSKHHGKDILRKQNRKNRFLFSFPGLLAPVSGGKVGELKDLGSKNPTLYLDFPQGRMKLFGTIVYPQNRYLTLQFSKGGKNVMCEDYFDTMIVFSDAWWIGTKEENPEETQLSFPENMNTEQKNGFDFKGGAGSTSERIQGVNQSKVTDLKHHSPIKDLESDLSDSENDAKDSIQTTATRHSSRTSGKTYKFAESSADEAIDLDIDTDSSDEEKKELGVSRSAGRAEKPTLKWTEVQNWFLERQKVLSSKDTSPNVPNNFPAEQEACVLKNMNKTSDFSKGEKDIDLSKLEFEAKSSDDDAWYDVETFITHRFLSSRGPEVLVRYIGFGTEEDEWVPVKNVRQRSVPLEQSECHKVSIGDTVLCFQEKTDEARYYDAEVLDIQMKLHDIRGCICILLIRYEHDNSESLEKITDAYLDQYLWYEGDKRHLFHTSGQI